MTEQPQARVAGYERRFNALFAEYFDRLGTALDAPSFSRFTPDCVELLRDLSLRGGKRMRVVLLHEAARLVTAEPVEGLDAAALSVELLQTHGLVHDDLIDDSATRRGGPTTYYAYRERFPHHPRAALALTVLAGDLALALSLRVLLEAELPAEVRQAMVEVQTRAAADTFVGQIVDLERDFTDTAPDDDVLHAVADHKSARYSVLAPLCLGLLAAESNRPPTKRSCATTPACSASADRCATTTWTCSATRRRWGSRPVPTSARAGTRTPSSACCRP
ncbi:Polyprenyl synthetase family protein OS=Streptomyces tendae OX=1932 GN=GUR47_05620 PE=3 SV=1 [Streptomyces tendae]